VGEKERIKDLLDKGLQDGVYPGAVLLVAYGNGVVFIEEAGHVSSAPYSASVKEDTIFDLASLTKPLATTLAVMKLVDRGDLYLDDPLEDLLPRKIPGDKRHLTPRLLLCHCSGLVDWEPFYLDLLKYSQEERKRVLRSKILEKPLAYVTGSQCLYSDLGFMMLEWVIEEAAQMSMAQFLGLHFYEPLSFKRIFLGGTVLAQDLEKNQFAATEDCSWRKRVLQGEVHDENAFALGGYSGHAGLFGTAHELYVLMDILRAHLIGERQDYFMPGLVSAFLTRQDIINGSTWALGWDTPSPENSSSGKYFSKNSVGHLGFTGTSVWMDFEKDVIVIFLTNRIHPTRNNEKIKAFRPELHDQVMWELGLV